MQGDEFRCEVAKSNEDQFGNKTTTVVCHGKLVSGQPLSEVKEAIRPLIASGGRIVVDLADVSYLDSSGLGALVSLKVSALKQGYCILEFVEMTPRVMELLRLSNLAQMLTAKSQ